MRSRGRKCERNWIETVLNDGGFEARRGDRAVHDTENGLKFQRQRTGHQIKGHVKCSGEGE